MHFTIITITLITILGAALRIMGITKDGGLWNDEYVSWAIATIPFGKGFVHGIFHQCHMPFYYLYLKFFNMFSSNDTFLRVTSVIPGIISIPVMYIVGKEKSKLTGYMCAVFTALSSLLIYYSQEVRFYSLLFLFSALSLYFTIRIIQKPRKRNLTGLIISNFLILFTHTIGFVYVFFDLVFVSIKLKRFYKKFVKITWLLTGILMLTLLPLMIKIMLLTNSISQWWSKISFNRIMQLICDYFTPVISNISLIENIHGISLESVCIVIPSLISIAVFIAAIADKNLRKQNQILLIPASLVLVGITAASLGKFALEAKYLMEIYPVLILVFCATIDSCNRIWFKSLIFFIFFSSQIAYIFSPNYASFRPREEGNKYVADLVENSKLKKGDFIVMTYYPVSRFQKYADFSKFNVLEIYKGNFNYFYTPFLTSEEALKVGKNKYRGAFLNSITPVERFYGSSLINKINEEVYYKMKPGQKVAFIFLDSVTFLDEPTFSAVVTNPELYKKAALPYLVFSNIRNEIVKTLPINASHIRYEAKGAWTVVTVEY